MIPATNKEEEKANIPPHYFVFEFNKKTNKKKAKRNLERTATLMSRQQEKELEDLEDLTPNEER